MHADYYSGLSLSLIAEQPQHHRSFALLDILRSGLWQIAFIVELKRNNCATFINIVVAQQHADSPTPDTARRREKPTTTNLLPFYTPPPSLLRQRYQGTAHTTHYLQALLSDWVSGPLSFFVLHAIHIY